MLLNLSKARVARDRDVKDSNTRKIAQKKLREKKKQKGRIVAKSLHHIQVNYGVLPQPFNLLKTIHVRAGVYSAVARTSQQLTLPTV